MQSVTERRTKRVLKCGGSGGREEGVREVEKREREGERYRHRVKVMVIYMTATDKRGSSCTRPRISPRKMKRENFFLM